MPNKIHHRPIIYLPVKKKEPADAKSFSFRDALTILGGITGLVVAALWEAGRFYTRGYFAVMNIPSSQINYSVWEYVETSWLRFILYFMKAISPPLSLIAISIVIFMAALFGLQKIFPRLKILKALSNFQSALEKFSRPNRNTILISAGLLFFYFFFLTLGVISQAGRNDGLKAVLTQSYSVDVHSKEYLPLGPYDMTPGTTLFHYSGLRLLTSNGGKYYLFRDVDSLTCQPVQVYILEDTENIQIILSEVSSVNTPCAAAAGLITP